MSRHAVFEFSSPQHGCAPKRILAYGDSLTAGYPDYEPYAKSLVDTCTAVGFPVTVVGCGLCGHTSTDMAFALMSRCVHDTCKRTGIGLEKLLQDVSGDDGPFDLALLMVGTNDILEASSGVRDICAAIGKLHAACHKYGLRTVACSIPDLSLEPAHSKRRAWQEVNDCLRSWVAQDGGEGSFYFGPQASADMVHFVDSAAFLLHTCSGDDWEEDGIHFTASGSRRFGAAMARKVAPLLWPGVENADMDVLSAQVGLEALHMGEAPSSCTGPTMVALAAKSVLVLGGSVAAGGGASPGKGWVDLLSTASQAHGFELRNESVAGLTSSEWQERLCDASSSDLEACAVVLLCLSPCDEGLLECTTAEDCASLMEDYVQSLTLAAFIVRGKVRDDARLVIAGPHPHGGYSAFHLEALNQVRIAILESDAGDLAVDFLQPSLHSGDGRWAVGLSACDVAAFPNDAGHREMYNCLDVASILGLR